MTTHNCSKACRSSGGEAKSERTLAIIEPDGLFGNHTDAVKEIILESGFRIVMEKIVQLDQDSAASFYAEHSARSFFHSLVQYMTRYITPCPNCAVLVLWDCHAY